MRIAAVFFDVDFTLIHPGPTFLAEGYQRFCARYDIGYLRADAERPFEEIVLKAFRQGRFVS